MTVSIWLNRVERWLFCSSNEKGQDCPGCPSTVIPSTELIKSWSSSSNSFASIAASAKGGVGAVALTVRFSIDERDRIANWDVGSMDKLLGSSLDGKFSSPAKSVSSRSKKSISSMLVT